MRSNHNLRVRSSPRFFRPLQLSTSRTDTIIYYCFQKKTIQNLKNTEIEVYFCFHFFKGTFILSKPSQNLYFVTITCKRKSTFLFYAIITTNLLKFIKIYTLIHLLKLKKQKYPDKSNTIMIFTTQSVTKAAQDTISKKIICRRKRVSNLKHIN